MDGHHDRHKSVRSSARSTDLGARRNEYLLSQLSLDSRKSTRTGEHHPYIKMERGAPTEAMNPFPCSGVRPSTANSSNNSRVSGGSAISESSANAGNSGALRRYLIALHKHTTGRDPDERAMSEINACLLADPERSNICNETRYVEKLKLHLIKQGREKDAKRVMELHQKLRGMSVVTNRESVIRLMYNLFDKEATRAAFTSTRKPPASVASIQESNDKGGEESVLSVEIGNYYGSTSYTRHVKQKVPQAASNHADDASQNDIDYTPIPRLHCTSDKMLNQNLVGDTKVPSLSKPCTGIKVETDKECNWDQSSHLDSIHRSGGPPTWQSISTISREGDGFPRQLRSGMDSAIGSSRQVVASTPIDNSTAVNRQRQFVNLRKPQENNVVSLRGHPSFKVPTASTGQTFASTKNMERDLIRDIVFILQGIDGNYIKSTMKGTFEIVAKQFVHPTLRLHTMKLCELGFCYSKIRNYCDKPTNGLMAQGFKQAIEKELKEYYRLLAVIQEQIQQTVVDTPLSEDLPVKKIGDMTMLKLTIWLFDCRPRLQVLSGMVESCQSKRGGELCSVIHTYSQHGDPIVRDLTISLLSTICKPLYIMLSQWILYGELEDPFNEFFIAGDPTCKREQLWHMKYRIRPQMLPSFISMKQAEKIMSIGKNINFLKEICNNADEFEGRYEVKALLETGQVESLFWGENSPIQYAIEMSYKTTSEKVLKVLIDDSNLLIHLKAIKKYMLLGQGDFIQYFLELIQDELSKPASKLYNHNISAILESAVRATNAQFENDDILSRLDTRILPTSDKDLGWDVFCLDYKAHGPIGTVLTENIMNGYNKLFNSLWRTKRIEIILSTLWKNQTVLFKYLRLIPELAPVLHRSQLLISEMIHFVHQTQYYIMFEATECAWERLMEDVNKASDLDEVIKSHQKFLDTIFKRSLLDAESRDLLNQLRGIFDSVHELRAFLKEFNERVEVEVKSRKDLQPNTEEVRSAQRQFFASYVMQAKGKIETLYTTTQDLVRTFLLVLNRQQDLTLQCLSFRLDFNEYYHQKDSRLSQPLTFQHRRLSSNAFTPLNMSGSFTGMNASQLVTSMSIPEMSED